MSVWYEHTLQFCYTADWGQFSSSDTQYYNFFFPLKNISYSNFEKALKGTGT